MTAADSVSADQIDLTGDQQLESGEPIPIARPDLPPLAAYTELLGEVWDSKMLSNFGPISRQLEAEAAAHLGVAHVRATASGDIGLTAVIAALDLPPGSPCFLSPYTFNSTINAALWNQLRPVFVDIDRCTYNMHPKALAHAVSKETAMHGASEGLVLATHVFGNPCEIEALELVASDAGLRLVFDAAHGLGSLHRGRRIGNFGDAEMFSLSGTKVVTSAEGGLISTGHEWLMDRLELVRGYGFRGNYQSERLGLNGKMSELHAALGLINLRRIDEIVATRSRHVAEYRAVLGDRVGWQHVADDDFSATKDLVVDLGNRRPKVEAALTAASIQTKRYFVPLHTMPAYGRFASGPLPMAEAAFERSLCIPLFSDMTSVQVRRVCDVILDATG